MEGSTEPPSISPPIRGLSKNGGFGRKTVPSSGGVSWTPLPQGVPLFRWLSGVEPNFLTSVELQPCAAIWTTIKRQRWALEGGSDCAGAARERGLLCLALGSAAVSVTSDFDLERRVRLGLGLVSTGCSTFVMADSAVAGAEATASVDFRPSPSCFARDDRCSEYAGAVRG